RVPLYPFFSPARFHQSDSRPRAPPTKPPSPGAAREQEGSAPVPRYLSLRPLDSPDRTRRSILIRLLFFLFSLADSSRSERDPAGRRPAMSGVFGRVFGKSKEQSQASALASIDKLSE
uniref:Uncharacterized protein n=1 Tax=Aegilops tauschii subsp. strangulata TaxID=200361 RepID=A0A453SFU7_AEGTS